MLGCEIVQAPTSDVACFAQPCGLPPEHWQIRCGLYFGQSVANARQYFNTIKDGTDWKQPEAGRRLRSLEGTACGFSLFAHCLALPVLQGAGRKVVIGQCSVEI